jgi:hypothetical protein
MAGSAEPNQVPPVARAHLGSGHEVVQLAVNATLVHNVNRPRLARRLEPYHDALAFRESGL